jgi:regulator of RNase E activity RraA
MTLLCGGSPDFAIRRIARGWAGSAGLRVPLGRGFWELVTATVFVSALLVSPASGQVYTWTPKQMSKYTAQNPYERFPGGRPKVPDDLLAEVKALTAEDLAFPRNGYQSQFVDTLLNLHPDKKLVARSVTLLLAPLRADAGDVIQADWRARGNQRPIDHDTALDTLGPNDMIVIDAFRSIPVGGIIGDNLAYYISQKTGTGLVIDGPIRDLDGISDMPGFFVGLEPSFIHGTMAMGIDIPVRIGATMVMPGDVVPGDRTGIVFIPPHLVEGVVDAAAAKPKQ